MKSRSGDHPSPSDIYLHVAVLQIQINFLAVHTNWAMFYHLNFCVISGLSDSHQYVWPHRDVGTPKPETTAG
jgi:hypothetical protein